MSEGKSYPSVLKAAAMRLSNYSSTIRKVLPMGPTGDYKAGGTIRFMLPANALVDLRTLKLHFKGSTRSATADNAKGYVAFPSGIESVIDQIIVSANGVQIEQTQPMWGWLVKMLQDFTMGAEKRQARNLLQGEHLDGIDPATGEFYKSFNGYVGADAAPFAQPLIKQGTRTTNRPFVVDEFPACFLGTVEPRVISTALTGDIMIEFRLAPNSVLVALGLETTRQAPDDSLHADVTGTPDANDLYAGNPATTSAETAPPTGAHYVLDDVYLSAKTIDIADGEFYRWLSSSIESKPLEMPFQHWYSQPGQTLNGNANGTTRMTVNSSSINMLIGTFQPTDYADGGVSPGLKVTAVSPAKATTGAAFDYSKLGTYGNSQTSRYFQRGSINKDTYEGSFTINNVQIGYPATAADVWSQVRDEFQLQSSTATGLNPRINNLQSFAQAFFVHPLRLNLKADDSALDNTRYVSGLDSRASTVNIMWSTKGTTDTELDVGEGLIPMIWAGTTSVLRLSPGRSIDLVL
jgi:hypothetical protein